MWLFLGKLVFQFVGRQYGCLLRRTEATGDDEFAAVVQKVESQTRRQ